MSKLNINLFDTRDLITQSKNLTEAQRREAQIARLYLTQGSMPVYSDGNTGRFVMLSNMFFKNKTMSEPAFKLGLTKVGKTLGYDEVDVLETYTESSAMALCNFLQKKTLERYQQKGSKANEEILKMVEDKTKDFGRFARAAQVDLGVVIAVEQQLKKDLEQAKQQAKVVEGKEL